MDMQSTKALFIICRRWHCLLAVVAPSCTEISHVKVSRWHAFFCCCCMHLAGEIH